MREEVDHIRDRLELPVDSGIKDTITAFRYLEFQTDGSCEGHIERGSNAPWVDFDFLSRSIRQRLNEARKAAGGKWNDPRVQSLLEEAKGEVLLGAERLMALLDEFYEERHVSSERRLVLEFYPASVRLQSQGTEIQRYRSPDGKPKYLSIFQNEMDMFTEFLKQKIFSEN